MVIRVSTLSFAPGSPMNAATLALCSLLTITLIGCGNRTESAAEEYTVLYGELATTLEAVDDEDSAQAASAEIDAMTPRLMAAGAAMSSTSSGGRSPSEVSLEVLTAMGNQEQRLKIQMKRLNADEDLWPLVEPALQKTMLLNTKLLDAMPLR